MLCCDESTHHTTHHTVFSGPAHAVVERTSLTQQRRTCRSKGKGATMAHLSLSASQLPWVSAQPLFDPPRPPPSAPPQPLSHFHVVFRRPLHCFPPRHKAVLPT